MRDLGFEPRTNTAYKTVALTMTELIPQIPQPTLTNGLLWGSFYFSDSAEKGVNLWASWYESPHVLTWLLPRPASGMIFIYRCFKHYIFFYQMEKGFSSSTTKLSLFKSIIPTEPLRSLRLFKTITSA